MPIRLGIAASQGRPIVTGGTLTSDATYFYRTFTANGTLTVSRAPLVCEYLVVAGGGGCGYTSGRAIGGAGAGGLRSESVTLPVGSYNATVGAGGAITQQGTGSSFNSLNTTGGGTAPAVSAGRPGTGGSGGGGTAEVNTTGATGNAGGYSPAEGTSGGNANANANGGAGGGGGATITGSNGTATLGGAGGDGSSAFSSWGVATGTGQNVSGTRWYAGGGGGGSTDYNPPLTDVSAGGKGGGGLGIYFIPTGGFNNGTINTGGGAGGYFTATGATPTSGNGVGGSGIVIVRYLKSAV